MTDEQRAVDRGRAIGELIALAAAGTHHVAADGTHSWALPGDRVWTSHAYERRGILFTPELPGIYRHSRGGWAFNVGELLALVELEDTPANRAEVLDILQAELPGVTELGADA